ncbi:MAG: DUF134 domain-containing protein [Anaerovibrio sp.]|nr:DUF134 domain-containing protein [Anaerovibrio sp.]
MARPTKCRRVCHAPRISEFVPAGDSTAQPVILNIDEYETIRLMDNEGMSQQQCSEHMGVARTTVQKIYEEARRKVALALVAGCPLRIEGGDFLLCDGCSPVCENKSCYKAIYQRLINCKGDNIMRIGVTYADGQIFQHFGHTEEFKIYDVEDGRVTASEVVSTNGSGHGALAGVLKTLKVDVLICGGIGGGAQNALAAEGIRLYGGAAGSADKAVEALLAGTLSFNPDVHCDHHDHNHGNGGHTCGNHGCH